MADASAGQTLYLIAQFTEANVPPVPFAPLVYADADPTTVMVSIRDPLDALIVPAVVPVKQADGYYTATFTPPISGRYTYRWSGVRGLTSWSSPLTVVEVR